MPAQRALENDVQRIGELRHDVRRLVRENVLRLLAVRTDEILASVLTTVQQGSHLLGRRVHHIYVDG